jgi:hypothetical protein
MLKALGGIFSECHYAETNYAESHFTDSHNTQCSLITLYVGSLCCV